MLTREQSARERGIQKLRVATVTRARTTAGQKTSRTAALKAVQKAFGNESLGTLMGKKRQQIPCISVGDRALDDWLTGRTERDKDDKTITVEGSGRGLPKGRIIEVYGPEHCLASDTFVQYTVWSGDGVRINHKGGSIERLFERFHGLHQYHRQIDCAVSFSASSVNAEGRVFQNRIVNVYKNGRQECFRVETASGAVVEATAEHKFFVGVKFVPLKELEVGHAVTLHNTHNQVDALGYVVPDEIVSITSVGERETYDLRVEAPFNNYVANGLVVHNSGKTTLTLEIIAAFQAQGFACGFIDVEHALDPVYAEGIGVDFDTLQFSQPDSAEQALNITMMLVDRNALDLIVIDSVAALTPDAEQDGEIGDSHPGLQARLMSQALRMLTAKLNKKSDTIVIFVNQIRMKIGIRFGNPETTSGGKALRFYAAMRINCRYVGKLQNKQVVIGQRTKLELAKSKVSVPFRVIHVDIVEGRGITAVHKGLKVKR